MKTYSTHDILTKFSALTRLQKIDILWDALDYMQQYNGRNRVDCIALAMGFELTSDSKGNECYSKPKES